MSETEKKYNSCQSCGLPFNKDPQLGGSNADGSKSNMYCSYCFENGSFVNPGLTAADMQAYAAKKLQQYGIPVMLANLLTKGIPDLERWKQAQ